MKLTIDELHRIETDMLASIMQITKELNLPVFAAYGTVLGAIRHHGPIPWDPDADTVVPLSDFENVCKILSERLPEKYHVRSYYTDDDQKILYAKVGLKNYHDDRLHVDIFPLIPAPDSETRRYWYHFVTVTLKWIHWNKMHRLSRKNLLGMICCKLVPLSQNTIRSMYYKWINRYVGKNTKYCFVSHGTYSNTRVFFDNKHYQNGQYVDYDGIKIKIPNDYDEYLRLQYGDYMEFPPESERNAYLGATFIINEM